MTPPKKVEKNLPKGETPENTSCSSWLSSTLKSPPKNISTSPARSPQSPSKSEDSLDFDCLVQSTPTLPPPQEDSMLITPNFSVTSAPSTPKLNPPHTSTPFPKHTQDLLGTALLLNETAHKVADFDVLAGENYPSAEGVPNPDIPLAADISEDDQDNFIPQWERRGSKEPEDSKKTKNYILKLFSEDGFRKSLSRAKCIKLAETDLKFGGIWKVLLDWKKNAKLAYEVISKFLDRECKGMLVDPVPPPPPPSSRQGLRDHQKAHFLVEFGPNQIKGVWSQLTNWISSHRDDPVWESVVADHRSEDKAKRAIHSFFNGRNTMLKAKAS